MSEFILNALWCIAGLVVGLGGGWYLRGRYLDRVNKMIADAKADVKKVEKKVGL